MASLYRRVRNAGHQILYLPAVKSIFTELPVTRKLYSTWERRHPFDKAYGVDTSGFLSVEEIHPDPKTNALIMPYCGSQPSIVRKALSAIERPAEYAFADLGCGKGRAAIVASEFGFRELLGVELSPDLAKIARSNAAVVAYKYPERKPVQVFQKNVLDFAFPQGKLVLFMYHPFKEDILSRLIKRLERMLGSEITDLLVVYYNPVHFDLFDNSMAFRRFFDESIRYDASEIGCGPDLSDKVVIWRSV